MTFERTPFGQTNRAIFLGVDYVCYVEGAEHTDRGDDITFWSAIFSTTRPDLKVKIIPRGGKPVLESLAKDIVEKGIGKSLVAMDADYSRFFGNLIDDHRALYTYGYSWENDVCDINNLVFSAVNLSKTQALRPEAETALRKIVSDFDKIFFWIMAADIIGLSRKTSVIPRDKPGRLIEKTHDGTPALRRDQAFALMQQAKLNKTQHTYRTIITFPSKPSEHAVGKVVAFYSKLSVLKVLKDFYRVNNFDTDHFIILCTLALRDRIGMGENSPLTQHYINQMSLI